MKQRNIMRAHQQDEFVERDVRAGEPQDASEAIRDALRVLQQRREKNAGKLEQLRVEIEAGIDDLENGDFVEIDDADLDAHIEGLGGIEGSGSS